MSGLGWVALHSNGGVLHHRSSWELENTAIYEGCPLYRPPYIHRLFNRRSDRGAAVFVIHKSTPGWFCKVRNLSVRGCRDDMWRPAQYRLGGTVTNIGVSDCVTQTMMGSWPRIWATMLLLAYPFLAAGAATCTALAGKCWLQYLRTYR